MNHEHTTFKRVLVANRGEIAVRIIRALRELGIESVAVYSDADRTSRHVTMADWAVRLPGVASADTYLKIPLLVSAATETKCDGVHPGYGFLSESAAFADAMTEAKIKFIGPSAKAMQLMGDKIEARRLMQANGIPMVPGVEHPLASAKELAEVAQEIGFPLILKAAAGGGGRGMRVVRNMNELDEAFAACSREAQAYFGNPAVFCERYIEHPRHIEFQVLFDQHGHGVHLFERDCSVQRRHQKLFEEAPSPYLDDTQRARLGAIAVRAAQLADYVGAGTIEFISESPERTYFMEMNTRIQVEHPVTEMITGIDLIKAQIEVAMGKPLPYTQEEIPLNGWAMEARINAEDPVQDFRPAGGVITQLEMPQGPFVRVDTHLYPGYEVPTAYDSMVAKLIVWGRDRNEALARMQRALGEVKLRGLPTTARFHQALIAHPRFRSGSFTTRFLEEEHDTLQDAMTAGDTDPAGLLGAIAVATQKSMPVMSDDQLTWQQEARREAVEI